MELKANIPGGPIEQKWQQHRFEMKLVNPANKRKYSVIVVGSGLAGGAGAASMAELGYQVKCFCYQDSPRRAHSIAAQGGINAAKNYPNDGDSVYRLFYDTVKGGDFRAREANVYRLAELSVNIIDQCVAQGVPFAREYGGLLANRSFGGAQVSRTFYARGQTGQQLLLGAYQALERQIGLGKVEMFPRHEMLDLIVIDGRARGIVVRDMVTGEIESHLADAVCLATGGYGNVFYLATYAKGCNATAIWRAYKRGAAFANPCYTQIHPTCIPVTGDHQSKLTLMSESLRNDGRIWVPKQKGDRRAPRDIPEGERDYYLERMYPSFGNLAPRDIASRAAKRVCDEGRGVGPSGLGVYLDFASAIQRLGEPAIREKYVNLFEMYERITDENPYQVPMRIYPASHYTMGGLWVDYNLMSTIPGLHVLGEANFSDHGANRLGASALMQWLLHHPLHHRQLPREHQVREGGREPRRREAGRGQRRRAGEAPPRHQGQAHADLVPSRAGKDHVGALRHGPESGRARARAGRNPRAPAAVLAGRERARRRQLAQPVARARGAGGRFPGARRAHVHGRARAPGILRRPFPRGVPDSGRRSQARRRSLLQRGGLGVRRPGSEAEPFSRAARLRTRASGATELQVRKDDPRS
jgi:succinate dehydrogenase/fumarate reductase flavoprotein subunit